MPSRPTSSNLNPEGVRNPFDHLTRTDPTAPPPVPLGPMAHNHEHRGQPLTAEENVPNRFELFILGPGEKKVTEETDTRVPDASVFTFNKEDHTLGNLLCAQLNSSHHVSFAGYKVPHPLESKFILRVQTDGTITPRAAVIQACRDLVHDFGIFNQEFTKEYELRRMVSADDNTTATAATGAAPATAPGTDAPANTGGAANQSTE